MIYVKEFIDFGRALSEAQDVDASQFHEFLSRHGHDSLNEYHACSDSDTLKRMNYELWLEEIAKDRPEFEMAKSIEEHKLSGNDIPDSLPEEKEVEVEKPKLRAKVKGKTKAGDNDDLNEVLTGLKDALSSMKIGGGEDISERLNEQSVRMSEHAVRMDAIDRITDESRNRLKEHETKLDALAQGGSTRFEFSVANVTDNDIPTEGHYKFPLVSAAVLNNIPTMVVGPAGWGKTSMVAELASLLSGARDDFSCDDYRIQSIGPQTSKSDILGYMDANGSYVESVFYQCFKDGYIYACDEADAGSAGSLTLLNQGFANKECYFPGQGMVKRHDNFVPMFLANTYGQGANATYVGRNQLDAATLDRLAVVEYDYDSAWEARIAGCTAEGSTLKIDAGGSRTDQEWMEYVQRIRASVDRLAVRHVVSPRATFNGIKLLNAGVGFTHVANMCLWKGLDSATRTKVINECDNNDE